MKKNQIVKIDRRTFLKSGLIGSTGLILGTQIACSSYFSDEKKSNTVFNPNVFVSINSNGDVTIIAHRSEMGTGIRTSLPAIVADEMEADWDRVTIQQALADKELYGDQNTDASYSMRMFYMPMRKLGASVRMMLEQAAANHWNVDVEECKAENHGVIHHSSGRRLTFGELVEIASKLDVPDESLVKLKSDKDFSRIGKDTSITDLKDIVTGKVIFGLDTMVPDSKIAVVKRCPVAGGKIMSYDADAALKITGVLQVFTLDSPGFPTRFDIPMGGVVVVAENTWAAIKGRDAVEVEWDYGINSDYDSGEYISQLVRNTDGEMTIRRENGNVDEAMAEASELIDHTYILQYLSHSPMEPPCGVAYAQMDKCELWVPTQNPQWVQRAVASALQIEVNNVKVNVTLIGGGFGRKSKPDFTVEASVISKLANAPIKLFWTREDDILHDFYHACSVQRIKIGLDENKKVLVWNQKSMFPPIGGTSNAKNIQPGKNEMNKGFVDFPYQIENIRLETGNAPAKARIGWFRSVSNVQHAFAIGSMMDELAEARGIDPVKNALDLLGPDRHIAREVFGEDFQNYKTELSDYPWDTARFRRVINEVAAKSNWGKKLPKGRGQGFYAHRCSLTYVACVVEVETDSIGKILSIPGIHYAVDCGVAVNRDRVVSQFEGGAVFALSAALKGAITFKNGRVQQQNFDEYYVTNMKDAPKNIYVHLIESNEKPTGVGEAPVPPVAPALANAIYAASGRRIRKLPLIG
ncbi:molybdopterin cofactor-binding domain-containing protein [Reichenbachiella sp. MALMAid0571]|uniref:xanthine dehydrogenase family protein molybdopterin-binding subunit n=1 Tax=Reichenbachiella sp. MALMAid0571 TaxID=3143939 RepID=UPI0032E0345C